MSKFSEKAKGTDSFNLAVEVNKKFQDIAILKVAWKVEKFLAKDSKEIEEKNIKPYETIEKEHNCLLHEGILNFRNLIAGLGSPTAWNNANARIGVGNDATAPADTQTGLLGASKLYKAMNAGYPQNSGDHDSVWQSDFVSGEAEWIWLEEAIDNGVAAGIDICRQNTSLSGGVAKPSGQTWRLTGTITWS